MTQSKRLKSLRWLAFVMLGMVLFCGGGSFIALLVSKNASERSLQAKLEQLSAKGIPVDDASMAELHETLTSTENLDNWVGIIDKLASKDFLNQCENLPIVGANKNPIPKVGDPWVDEKLEVGQATDFSKLRDDEAVVGCRSNQWTRKVSNPV